MQSGTSGGHQVGEVHGKPSGETMAALPSAPTFPSAQPPSYEETTGINNSAPYPHPAPGYGAGPPVKGGDAPPYTTQPRPAERQQPVPIQTVYIQSQVFYDRPVQMSCSFCHQMIVTQTTHNPGTLAWLLCGSLCLLGCWAGCCFIPFCVDAVLDVDHHCPYCQALLGSYRRI